MKISSEQIPQADVLNEVIRTVVAVGNGATTYQEISAAIGKVERQGRYYRKAAEIIGLVQTPQSNHSVLTPNGQNFIMSGPDINNPLLLQAVLSAEIFQRVIPYLELHISSGLTREEIIQFIIDNSVLEEGSMSHRRVSSVVAWLETLEIISKVGNKLFLQADNVNRFIQVLHFSNINEPLLPRRTNLQDYQMVEMRAKLARETIVTYRNQAATDRADNAHRHLVNLVAERVRATGAIPRYNQIIDLATRYETEDYIFEMKSITTANSKSQVRGALSQLYEYKYLQNLPNSNLVLVLEQPLPNETAWMVDYLENDRNINVIWDGDNELYASERTKDKLGFLGII